MRFLAILVDDEDTSAPARTLAEILGRFLQAASDTDKATLEKLVM